MSADSTENRLSRGHKKRERTRNQLIAAGLRTLAAKGEALTVSDVVAEADVSNGTFYNYFVDREELIDTLAAHLVSMLSSEAAVEVETDDAALRFATISARVIARGLADPTWAHVVLRLETLRADAQLHATSYMREDLELGRSQGRFEVGADPATVDLIAAMLMICLRRIVTGSARFDYFLDALARLLRALGVPRDETRDIAERALADAGVPRG
jgi:AcrR family transcriptional regulator